MTKPEQLQWQYLSKAMSGLWDAQRHEDRYSPDIPDVSYAIQNVDGWIELKTLMKYPVNPDKPIRLAHLRSGQVNWIERRGAAGAGRVFLLLAVGQAMAKADWYLIRWPDVRDLYDGKITRAELGEPRSGPELARFLRRRLLLEY